MNARPIINIRNQLRWYQRLSCDAATLALWSAWLWLCRPAILGGVGMVGAAFGLQRPARGTPAYNAVPSIEEMALLLLWNRLSRIPAVRPRVQQIPDYAGHFGMAQHQIDSARASQRCVVHHDEQGRIIAIEADRAGDTHPQDHRPLDVAA